MLDGYSRINELPDFRLGTASRSLLVVPVVHESEVRALIRVASPKVGGFLDEQARAMKTLESFARYGILRLDERRQRQQMSSALGFHIREISIANVVEPGLLMQGVLSALGAEWGTFWTIDSIDDGGQARISRGLRFGCDGTKDVEPRDRDCGIRVPNGSSQAAGFSQRLIQLNRAGSDNIFCLHIIPDRAKGAETIDSPFYLQQFSTSLGNRGKRATTPDLTLNPNTSDERHTRVAFTVNDGSAPRAIVWLKFPGLHEMAW